jgi:adenylylsulfate kinase-like enzyme
MKKAEPIILVFAGIPFFRSWHTFLKKGALGMSQYSQRWSGWSTISAHYEPGFTIWLTGLPGTGKKTLARLASKALTARGYKVEIIDTQALSRWLRLELHIQEDIREDNSHTPGFDAFTTYICAILARNGVISISTTVSPYIEARSFAREQIQRFVEVHLHCDERERQQRLALNEYIPSMPTELYQQPVAPELSINTSHEPPESSALRLIARLEQLGYIAPRWEDSESYDEEIEVIKARLQALGYLD